MQPTGCLILHGWTSTHRNVERLVPSVERLGLPYRMPTLRGHCGKPEDLYGITWRDWYDDALAALEDLLGETRQVILIGFSMGALLSLRLSLEHPDAVSCVVALATPIRATTRAMPLARYVSPFYKRYVKGPPRYTDMSLAAAHPNYRWVPISAVTELHELARTVEAHLPEVRCPLLLLQSRADRVVRPESVEIIARRAASREKQIVWFERTGHEMLLDCEAEEVAGTVERLLRQRIGRAEF